MFTPVASPEKNRMMMITPGVARPAVHTPQRPKAMTISAVWVANRMYLRGNRSASEPARGPIIKAGKNAMKAPTPSQVVDRVSSKRTNGTAMVCIHVPEFETSAATQNTA